MEIPVIKPTTAMVHRANTPQQRSCELSTSQSRQRWRQTGNQWRIKSPPAPNELCQTRRAEAITPVKQFRITASINKTRKTSPMPLTAFSAGIASANSAMLPIIAPDYHQTSLSSPITGCTKQHPDHNGDDNQHAVIFLVNSSGVEAVPHVGSVA